MLMNATFHQRPLHKEPLHPCQVAGAREAVIPIKVISHVVADAC